MRWLLLIMTGIGFTLGLLCGLLMQLPADGLPANHDSNGGDGAFVVEDAARRSRRSMGDNVVEVVSKDENGLAYERSNDKASEGLGGRLEAAGSMEVAVEKSEPSFRLPPNPQIATNTFVRNAGQGAAPALDRSGVKERGSREVESQTVEVGEKVTAESGSQSHHQQQRHPYVPVTSFTLRLKKTGDTVVVMDSAQGQERHKRQLDQSAQDIAWDSMPRTETGGQPPDAAQTDSLFANSSKPAADLLVRGVLWSQELEGACSDKVDSDDAASWRQRAAGLQVVAVEEGCGRMQNRLLTFRDGTKACARYRLNTDQIQGEVYSYYLAQLLNMTRYLPPSLFVPVDTLSGQWRAVHLQLSMAQWADGRLVVLTRWLPDLSPSHIPQELREDDRRLHPVPGSLRNKTLAELCDLLQWSDLLVFDYLTANLDRLVNNMFNRQWNAEMMNNPAHNLERTKSGTLVFLDNESGLFHGYRLLDKYRGYHDGLLASLCVFRRSTAAAVKALHRARDVGRRLEGLLTEGEVHHKHLPPMPDKNVDVLIDRLAKVHEQIVKCEALYGAIDDDGGAGTDNGLPLDGEDFNAGDAEAV